MNALLKEAVNLFGPSLSHSLGLTKPRHTYIVNYPSEESVHVHRIRHIEIIDADLYWKNELVDGDWVETPDFNEAPF